MNPSKINHVQSAQKSRYFRFRPNHLIQVATDFGSHPTGSTRSLVENFVRFALGRTVSEKRVRNSPMYFKWENFDPKIVPPAHHVTPGRKFYGPCTGSHGHPLHGINKKIADQSMWPVEESKKWLQTNKQKHTKRPPPSPGGLTLENLSVSLGCVRWQQRLKQSSKFLSDAQGKSYSQKHQKNGHAHWANEYMDASRP